MHSGERIGPYEIVEPIGAGGMGEVYRARDTRLDRDVAVKVLPHEVADDADRLARFEREAKAVAALSHPNILEIHDFGTHNATSYAVTELLEGETLRQRLDGGPLPVRKAAEIGSRIARGLAAAHEGGVVHRDLKPDNIFLTRDGRVKVLDFGLASLDVPGTGGDQSESPTVTRHTDPGTVLGTVGYMSPEQVRGEYVDHRSDLFSLGSILYEMVTGTRAFQRETAAETMTAILREDPPEGLDSGVGLPPGLDRTIRHCLEKQPGERFQSARDLAFDLDSVSSTSTTSTPASTVPTKKSRRGVPLWAALILGLIGLAAGMAIVSTMSETVQPDIQIRRLTSRRGRVWNARFVPGGGSVVYGASWENEPLQVFTTSVDNPLESRALDLGHADILSVSKTGELAVSLGRKLTVGWETSGTLAVVPLGGGAPRPVLEDVLDAEWDPQGQKLAVIRQVDGRFRLEYPIGNVLHETVGWIEALRFNPSGDRIAFIDHPLRGDNAGGIALVDMDGNTTLINDRGGHNLAWSPDGREIWSSFGNTVTASTPEGERRIAYRAPTALWIQDIAPDGRILLSGQTHRREMVALPPDATTEINLSWFDWSTPQGLSPDGRVVFFDEGNTRGESGYWIYIRSTDGSAPVRLGSGRSLSLSPDGRWLLTLANPFSDPHFALLPTGPGERRRLPKSRANPQALAAFLPDGESFVFAGNEPGVGMRLYLRSLDGSVERPITPAGIDFEYDGITVSPDGALVAAPNVDGDLMLYPISGAEARPALGTEPGQIPVQWSSDNKTLFVFHPGELPARIISVDLGSGQQTPWLELSPDDAAGVSVIDFVSLTPDGKSYVYSFKRLLSQLYVVDGLR